MWLQLNTRNRYKKCRQIYMHMYKQKWRTLVLKCCKNYWHIGSHLIRVCWVNESILCGLGQKYFEMLQISNKSKKSTTNRIYCWWFFRFPDCTMFSDRCISLFVHFIFINIFIFIDKTQTMQWTNKEINKSGNIVQQ